MDMYVRKDSDCVSFWNPIDIPCIEVVPESGYFHREIVMTIVITVVVLL